MSTRRASPRRPTASRSSRTSPRRSRWVGWAAGAAVVLIVAGALTWAALRRSPGASGAGGLPGPLGGSDVAQDVNTLVGKPGPAFTLADSEGKPYPVTPGQGRPTVLVFHMGIT